MENAPPERARAALLLVVLLALLIVFFYGRIPYEAEAYRGLDLHHYRIMAQAAPGVTTEVEQPFAYRVLGPYLAGLLPLPDPMAFYVLCIISVLALAAVFFGYLRDGGVSASMAVLTVVLLLLNKHLSGASIWNYFQLCDLLSLIAIVLLFGALEKGRWGLFGIVLFAGVLTRETPLLMVPVAFVFLLEKHLLAAQGKAFLMAVLPAVVAAMSLRLVIEPAGGLSLLVALREHGSKVLYPEMWFRILVNAFVPLSLLPLMFFATTRRFFGERRYMLAYLLLVVASTFFGSNNERLMAPAAIVFYLLMAWILERHWQNRSAALAILVVATVMTSLHHTWARYPLPSRRLTVLFSLGSLAVVTMVGLWIRWRERSRGPAAERAWA